MELLKEMCGIHAPSGNEIEMTNFLLDYIEKNKSSWKVQPEIFFGDGFQDCIMLKFGKPKTAILECQKQLCSKLCLRLNNNYNKNPTSVVFRLF